MSLGVAAARKLGHQIVMRHPNSIGPTEIGRKILALHPDMVDANGKPNGTIRGSVWDLDKRFPDIVKTGAGFARRLPLGAFKFYTGLKWSQLRDWRRITKDPVCVSLSNAPKYRFPVVDFPVSVDGGGFSILRKHAAWQTTPEQHARSMRKVIAGLGRVWIVWCAIQDWMCEPFMLKKTGLDVRGHQRRTVQSYIDLCRLAPDVPWLPVVQGWTLSEYIECIEMYRAAGIDLGECERVGVGSVCSRQSTAEGVEVIVYLLRLGLHVHAFGFKLDGLRALRKILTQEEWSRLHADSAAWSKHAWKSRILMPGHFHGNLTPNCANCVDYANVRRKEILTALGEAA